MRKVFEEKKGKKHYLKVDKYCSNDRLAISVLNSDDEYVTDITINLPNFIIQEPNQVFLSGNLSNKQVDDLIDKGIIEQTYGLKQYNMGRYYAVSINLDILKEYDPEGVAFFLKDNEVQSLLNQYNEQEVMDLLEKKVRLVYVDTGSERFVARYEDLPDIIVDLNDKLGSIDLKIYDYQNPSMTPILTTFGELLNKCDSDVRKDIIERLMKLQMEELEIKKYKVIDEDMLDNIEDLQKSNNEMER